MSTVDLIQSVGIILTVIVMIIQLRASDKSNKLSINAIMAEHISDLNATMLESGDVVSGFAEPYPVDGKLPLGDKRRMAAYRYLNLYDEAFFYKRAGIIGKREWLAWERSIKKIVSQPFVKGLWAEVRVEYEPDFQSVIGALIQP